MEKIKVHYKAIIFGEVSYLSEYVIINPNLSMTQIREAIIKLIWVPEFQALKILEINFNPKEDLEDSKDMVF